MTDEEINIAIAEARGWKLKWQNIGGGEFFDSKPKGHSWEVLVPPAGWHKSKEGRAFARDPEAWDARPPDYLNDLNAMHEAWEALTLAQKRQFETELYKVIIGNEDYNRNDDAMHITNATARQRAEAFVKTLNLKTT